MFLDESRHLVDDIDTEDILDRPMVNLTIDSASGFGLFYLLCSPREKRGSCVGIEDVDIGAVIYELDYRGVASASRAAVVSHGRGTRC